MKHKNCIRFLLIFAFLVIIPICATASQEKKESEIPISYNSHSELIKDIPKEAFGGMYINENGQTVVNIVRGAKFATDARTVDGSKVLIEYVDLPLSVLEKVHEALIPHMERFGIVMLDANDKTNKLDIALYQRSASLDAFLQNYIDLQYVNYIILSEGYSISFGVATTPPEIDHYSDLYSTDSRAAVTLYPGAVLRIGEMRYCTAGPRISSNQFYTCGHVLRNVLNTEQNVYIRNISAGITNWTHIGTTGNLTLGIAGDTCVVTTTNSCLPSANTFPMEIGTYSYTSPIIGSPVQMYGGYSGITNGTITQCDVTVNVDGIIISNLAQATYYSGSGDSGAGIFSENALYSLTSYCYGIQSCTAYDYNENWVASFFHQFHG